MSNLTHKEILDYLKENNVLYKIIEEIEEEDEEGELEIVGIKLNTVSGIISDLHEKQRSLDSLIRQMKEKIRSDEKGVYFEKLDRVKLEEQTINFQKDAYFLDCNQMIINACYIVNKRKNIGDKPMITIADSSARL